MQPASVEKRPSLSVVAPANRVPLDYDLSIPLVIDLDGTLLSTDVLHESLLLFLKRRPSQAWKIPGWIFSGRAIVKNRLADVVTDDDIETFPVCDEVVELAQKEAERGRKIALATAADITIAEKIRRRFPFIDEVIASSDGRNMKGAAKAQKVSAQFPHGFIYAGDSSRGPACLERSNGCDIRRPLCFHDAEDRDQDAPRRCAADEAAQFSDPAARSAVSSMGEKFARLRSADPRRQGA